MIKVIEKNVAEIIIAIVIVLSCSSFYTINEITMRDRERASKCNWVNVRR